MARSLSWARCTASIGTPSSVTRGSAFVTGASTSPIVQSLFGRDLSGVSAPHPEEPQEGTGTNIGTTTRRRQTMGSWHARASAASITGACVFAVVTGAGAVFVGDWYGSSHHGTVVTEFVTTPASAPHGSNPAVARSAPPAATGRHARGPAGSQVQADARTARVAGSSPRAPGRHANTVAAPVADDNSLGSQGPGPGSGRGSPSATGTETETPT